MGITIPAEDSGAAAAISLAHIAPFRLGAVEVSPATLQLTRGETRETLEPRVMQVLVALWQAKGAVVTRDELIARCWAGRIVGDNAIHRTISRLREVSLGIGAGCFRLETVNKIGYRLIALESALDAAAGEASAPAASSSPTRRQTSRLLVMVVAALTLAATALTMRVWRPQSHEISVAVETTGTSAPGSLASELANLASNHGGIAFSEGAGNDSPDYLLRVRGQRLGSRIQADTALMKVGSGNLLWSSSVSASDAALLQRKIAFGALRVIRCADEASDNIRRLDGGQTRLLLSGCEREDRLEDPDDLTVNLWRNVAQALPRDARALAMAAFVEAASADGSQPKTPIVVARRASAARHLQAARDIDGRLGLTYAAEAVMAPHWRYEDRLNLLNHGIAVDADCAIIHSLQADFWGDVGKLNRALASARRADEINPAEPRYRDQLILLTANAGYPATAAAQLKDAERVWPDSRVIQETRAHFDFRFGDAKQLLRKLQGGNAVANMPEPWTSRFAISFLLERAQPSPEHLAAAIRDALRFSQDTPWPALMNLVNVGAVDQAYAMLQHPANAAQFRQAETDILFRVYMRPFRLDRRFMGLADKLGLVQFWQSTGFWPDFCDDKDLPYDCEAEARRLHPVKAI